MHNQEYQITKIISEKKKTTSLAKVLPVYGAFQF